MEDADIVDRVLSGDIEAFSLLVQRYQRPVIGMVRGILGDPDFAEDIAQDVFLAAYAKIRRFDPVRSRFSTWLFAIARNHGVNALKRNRIRRRRLSPVTQHHDNPADRAMQRETLARLDTALAALPIRLKTALVLAHFEQVPYEQIAQIEGVSVGTVKSRVHRAKAMLAAALQQPHGEDA